MEYYTENGIYHLDFELSKLEKQMIDDCCAILEQKGFQYLSVPSTIAHKTFVDQGLQHITSSWVLDNEEGQLLGGSAEQGILQYFSNKEVEPMKIYAKNTCFRLEDKYEDLIRVKEFQKVEQFVFCNEKDWQESYSLVLENAITLLTKYNLKWRIRDVTKEDPGYHIKKSDIEVLTKKYGWMETHSCTYFGQEQSKRFNIKGGNHTISNTGVAVPRALIPIIEQLEE